MPFCYTLIKRRLDWMLALVILVLLSPLLLFLAIFVRIKLGKPIFFRQLRGGFRGETFEILKFRTMTNARDQSGNLLPDEKRLTEFGRWLRATSLDEIPALLNILRGEMSFVGPRPLMAEYLTLYNDVQKHRHDVRPGITGWAQVNGRNAVDWNRRFELDLWYVEHAGFFLDLKILWMTLKQIFIREGINHRGHATMPKFEGNRKG